MKFKCTCCGQEHESWPALAFDTPTFYEYLSKEDKKSVSEISSDFCIIKHEDQTDRFIRCTLTQCVNDFCENLDYGLWVSLSEESYNNYTTNFNDENHQTSYFGYLSNNIPEYEDTILIPVTVFTRTGNNRPEIVPHKEYDHPFVKDYYQGISKSEAEERIQEMKNKVA